jgi:hypothetical protein
MSNRVKNRFVAYGNQFKKFKNIIDPNNLYNIQLNDYLLLNSIEEYFKNSDEIKGKHNIEYTNEAKMFSLTMYSISKNKPIYITNNKQTNEMPKKILLINELYAVFLGISHLEYKKEFGKEDILMKFVYLLHYKCIEAETLAIIIDILMSILNKVKGEK